MRVLAILNSLDLGGTQLNAVDHARYLADHDVETTLVGFENTLPDSGHTVLEVARDRGIEIEVLGPQGTIVETAPVLSAVADRCGADIVHAYSSAQIRFGFWGPCRLGRRPLVMTMYEMAMPLYVPPRQHLIVGTKYLEEEQRSARSGPTHLISPPVDLEHDGDFVPTADFVREYDLDPDAVRFVIVSRLDETMKPRAVEFAVEAIERLDRPDVELVVAGGGAGEARLRSIGEQVNQSLDRRAVVFTGSLPDPRPAYASADVVIGMGGSAARGLAFGKPLIVSGEAGWYRLFTDDTAAALYRNSFWSDETVDDPVATLADIMRALIADSALRERLAVGGRRFAERNFSLSAMSAKLLDVYRESLTSSTRVAWFLDLGSEVRPAIDKVRRRLGR